MAQPVIASVKAETEVTNGAGFQGDFKTIWVGSTGLDIAISRDNGVNFVVYKAVPNGFFSIKGNFIGTSGQGTSATDLIACTW